MPAVSSRRARTRRRPMSEINVVPYIDVMLVLLVIFMVTAPFVPVTVIDLPAAGQGTARPDAFIEVVVPASGALTVQPRHMPDEQDERRTSLEELGTTLQELSGGNAALPIVISGDREVRYESILGVMDRIRDAGFTRPGLMVKPRNAPTP